MSNVRPTTHLGTGVGVAETQLRLLEEAARQRLHELGEVVADAAHDLADRLIGPAGHAQVLLDGSGERGLDLWVNEVTVSTRKQHNQRVVCPYHAKRELTGFLAFRNVGFDEILKYMKETHDPMSDCAIILDTMMAAHPEVIGHLVFCHRQNVFECILSRVEGVESNHLNNSLELC